MNGLLGYIRYALRQFRLSPGFTAAAVLTLALGIGGTTAIFTLIDAVMLRSLPVVDPASLYRVGDGDDCCVEGGTQDKWGMYSYPLFERLKAATPEFESVTAFQAGSGRLSVRRQGVDSVARPLRSEYVSADYFATFGIAAFPGRVFNGSDDTTGAPPVAILSHHVWESAYGADPSLVGATLTVEGHPFTVIGIAPAGFFGDTLRSDPPEIWIPLHQEPMIAGESSLLRQPVSAWLRVIGRLKPGANVAGMPARLTALLRLWIQNESGYPANWMPDIIRNLSKQVVDVIPAGAGVGVMKDEYGRSLRILLSVCGMVLLIACANVANLLLVRSVGRRGQTALRLAMGATRNQIVLQALAESILLALGGGIAGLFVAMAAARLLLALAFSASHFLPIAVTPSLVVLGFSFAVSLVTGVVFGAVPAWLATRTSPAEALRGLSRGSSARSSSTSTALLIVQATLSVVLVASATMLGRSLDKLQGQDFGYQVQGRVLVSLNRPPVNLNTAQLTVLYRQMETRLNSVPGVRGSGLALYNPLTDNWGELILVAGHPPPKMDEQSGSSWDRVSTAYLHNLGMTILRGRDFSPSDNETTAPVAIVNEAFVKRFFSGSEDPLEKYFGLDLPENTGTFRIVGVVRDAKFAGYALSKPARPMFYVPLAQNVAYANPLMQRLELSSHLVSGIMLVTDIPPGTLEPLLRGALAAVNPDLTITSVRTLKDQVALSFDRERAVASLASLFGIVALLLAAVGIYGVTAYSVARRTAEIGIRMALGAGRAKVVGMVMRGAATRVFIGLLAGLPLAIGAGRLISSELYGVSTWDPFALIVAGGALAICGSVAAVIPANRAAHRRSASAINPDNLPVGGRELPDSRAGSAEALINWTIRKQNGNQSGITRNPRVPVVPGEG
ncbi:MAG TPA: ABC transporter permease [Bryobacteraceae bacterium]|jgi:predicted permease|nr:ABC transporter permease [Bryobacteraceae bacterium]